MSNEHIAADLRNIIDELDRVRRGLMVDAPRRATFVWADKAKANAERLLSQIDDDEREFREAAE